MADPGECCAMEAITSFPKTLGNSVSDGTRAEDEAWALVLLLFHVTLMMER